MTLKEIAWFNGRNIYISAAIDHDIQSEVSGSVVVQTQLYIQTHVAHPNSLYAILMRFFLEASGWSLLETDGPIRIV